PRVCPRARVISLSTILRWKPANHLRPISSTTAHQNHGSSNEFGILNLRSTTQTPSMRALKMPHCFAPPTVVKRGMNFPDCAAMAQEPSGNQEPAVCVCTRSFWIRRIVTGYLLPSPLRVHFVLTTVVQPGNQSIGDCIHSTFRIRRQKW